MSGPSKKRRDRVEAVAQEMHTIWAEECGTSRDGAQRGWIEYAEFMRESWRDDARRVLKVLDNYDRRQGAVAVNTR